MPSTIERLPDLEIPGHVPSQPDGADHPMRVMTRRAAGLEGPPWDAAARSEVAALFDGLASEWHTRTSPERARVVDDALERGGVGTGGTAIELGSGTGAYTGVLADRFDRVVATELSIEMLRLAAAEPGHRSVDGAPTGVTVARPRSVAAARFPGVRRRRTSPARPRRRCGRRGWSPARG